MTQNLSDLLERNERIGQEVNHKHHVGDRKSILYEPLIFLKFWKRQQLFLKGVTFYLVDKGNYSTFEE